MFHLGNHRPLGVSLSNPNGNRVAMAMSAESDDAEENGGVSLLTAANRMASRAALVCGTAVRPSEPENGYENESRDNDKLENSDSGPDDSMVTQQQHIMNGMNGDTSNAGQPYGAPIPGNNESQVS
jgi:hypothetical protein